MIFNLIIYHHIILDLAKEPATQAHTAVIKAIGIAVISKSIISSLTGYAIGGTFPPCAIVMNPNFS